MLSNFLFALRRVAAIAGVFAIISCSALPTADWPPRSSYSANAIASLPVTADGVVSGAVAAPSSVTLSARTPTAPWGVSRPADVPVAPQAQTGALTATLASVSPGEAGITFGPGATPQQMTPLSRALAAVPAVVRRHPRVQCVPFARNASGIEIYGNANTWWRQAEGRYLRNATPAEGAVLVMRGYRTDRRGHVAVVTSVVSDREILVDHANWLNRGEVSVRTPVMDVSEAGDWSRVRVWHIPSKRWGARIYSVHGFIHQG